MEEAGGTHLRQINRKTLTYLSRIPWKPRWIFAEFYVFSHSETKHSKFKSRLPGNLELHLPFARKNICIDMLLGYIISKYIGI